MTRKIIRKGTGRKGMAPIVALAIISMAFLIIAVVFLTKAYDKSVESATTQNCRNSVVAHSFIATASAGDIYTTIKCPTRDITIKKLKDANKIIAEDMHRCWYEWGQGKERLFKGDGVFCHICSTYTFSDKGQNIDGMMNYLAANKIEIKYPGDIKGLTYMGYLQGYSTPGAGTMLTKTDSTGIGDQKIDTSNDYATILVYISGKETMDKWLEGGGRTGLLATGAALGIVGTAGGFLAIAIASNPVGWVAGAVLAIGTGVYMIYEAVTPSNPEWMTFTSFVKYDAETLTELGCQKFEVSQETNKDK